MTTSATRAWPSWTVEERGYGDRSEGANTSGGRPPRRGTRWTLAWVFRRARRGLCRCDGGKRRRPGALGAGLDLLTDQRRSHQMRLGLRWWERVLVGVGFSASDIAENASNRIGVAETRHPHLLFSANPTHGSTPELTLSWPQGDFITKRQRTVQPTMRAMVNAAPVRTWGSPDEEIVVVDDVKALRQAVHEVRRTVRSA